MKALAEAGGGWMIQGDVRCKPWAHSVELARRTRRDERRLERHGRRGGESWRPGCCGEFGKDALGDGGRALSAAGFEASTLGRRRELAGTGDDGRRLKSLPVRGQCAHESQKVWPLPQRCCLKTGSFSLFNGEREEAAQGKKLKSARVFRDPYGTGPPRK